MLKTDFVFLYVTDHFACIIKYRFTFVLNVATVYFDNYHKIRKKSNKSSHARVKNRNSHTMYQSYRNTCIYKTV